ncbi:MAG: 6-phosphofructokinase [Deltaproteobacteria bacterium]|nr:6-phosphofructokinase [Deltaproteobacteria bacterium]MBI4197327.1 6-phosphofructokinase [Deltaproteobacteria bacterium]
MKIAVLTGGGDCSGLNAAIRAVVRRAVSLRDDVYGIRHGWKGLLENDVIRLTVDGTSNILPLGGTILGSSRVNPFKVKNGLKRCLKNFKQRRFDALVFIGGEGTLNVAAALSKAGIPVFGIPKTIDNDAQGTDYTIGFDTAVQIATNAIDRLHTTAESHQRVMIIEVMGRHAGWIAAYAGIAGGADAVLIPEKVFPMKTLCSIIGKRARRGCNFSIVVVAEDAQIKLENGQILRTPLSRDEYGDVKLGGIGELLASEIRKRMDSEVRVTVLGHIQRGGTPTAFDRVLATRLGAHAVESLHRREFGRMAVIRGDKITSLPIKKMAGRVKKVDPAFYETVRLFLE